MALSGVLVCDWLPLNFDAASQLPCDLVVLTVLCRQARVCVIPLTRLFCPR
jgi:hypothetical protein